MLQFTFTLLVYRRYVWKLPEIYWSSLHQSSSIVPRWKTFGSTSNIDIFKPCTDVFDNKYFILQILAYFCKTSYALLHIASFHQPEGSHMLCPCFLKHFVKTEYQRLESWIGTQLDANIELPHYFLPNETCVKFIAPFLASAGPGQEICQREESEKSTYS